MPTDKNKSLDKKILDGTICFFKKGGWFCFLMFFIDLATKLGMNAYFGSPTNQLHDDITIIPNCLYLTLIYNTGAAYGTGANMGPWMRIVFACISFIFGVLVIYYLATHFNKISAWKRYAIYLALAGDWGNFIDRAFYWNKDGIYGVIDWIGVGGTNWPSFLTYICNWADICLTVGAIMYIVSFIVEYIKESKAEKNATNIQPNEEIGSSYSMAEKMMNESETSTDTKKESNDSIDNEQKLIDALKREVNEEKVMKEKPHKEIKKVEKTIPNDMNSLSDFLKGDE